MKRLLSTILIVVLFVGVFTLPAFAQADAQSVTIVYEDGSYVVETITEYANARATTKRGTKTSTYYTASNVAIFSVQVTGTFSYTGSSASAESASATVLIHDTDASYVTKSAYTSGRTAYASGTVLYNGNQRSLSTSLSCSNTGVLS